MSALADNIVSSLNTWFQDYLVANDSKVWTLAAGETINAASMGFVLRPVTAEEANKNKLKSYKAVFTIQVNGQEVYKDFVSSSWNGKPFQSNNLCVVSGEDMYVSVKYELDPDNYGILFKQPVVVTGNETLLACLGLCKPYDMVTTVDEDSFSTICTSLFASDSWTFAADLNTTKLVEKTAIQTASVVDFNLSYQQLVGLLPFVNTVTDPAI